MLPVRSGCLALKAGVAFCFSVRFVARLFVLSFCANVIAQTPTAAEFTVLRNFSRADGTSHDYYSRLVQASNGLIYGVKARGGTYDYGTLFRIGMDGTGFTVLRHFNVNDGTNPVCIIAGRDNRIYGVTQRDGFPTGGDATLFSVGLDGSGYSVLHRFRYATGIWVPGMLVEGPDGSIYGAGLGVGQDNYSSPVALFRIRRDGTAFTILRTLVSGTEGKGINGLTNTSLVFGPDGKLYGSTGGGGVHGCGTLFRLNPDGTGFTVLRQLAAADGRSPNQIIITGGGKIFGTAFAGGTHDLGTIFRMNLDGSGFAVVRNMVGSFPFPSNGSKPWAGLTEATDGMLYGTTIDGGESREFGTLFRINPSDGTHVLLRAFSATNDGSSVITELLPANNGKLYGMAHNGGSLANGTLFSYSIGRSSPLARGAVGTPFSYSTASLLGLSPTYFALGLPAGLRIDERTSEISGTPQQAGVFSVTFGASAGPPSVTLALTIEKGVAAITLSNLTATFDGAPKPVSVATTPPGLLTTVTYNGASSAPTSAGTYTVTVVINDTNYTGTTSGTLTIGAVAPRITSQSPNPIVLAGTDVTLTAAVSAGASSMLQWQRKPAGALAFSDLANDSGFAGATTASLSIITPTFTMDGDLFRLKVTNPAGEVVGEPILLTVHPASVLTNVSIRARINVGAPLTIGVVTNGERPMLIRAVGPGLLPFLGGGATVAGDPSLVITDSANVRLAANDNWGGAATLSASFASAGAFPLPSSSLDAAVVSNVTGSATSQVTVTSSGLGLIEVYDTGSGNGVRVVNLSALYQVGTDAEALVAGFVVTGSGSKRLLVRGIGPALRGFGLGGAIGDAKIDVFTSTGVLLVSNDDWPGTLAPVFAQAGAFALIAGSKDAALVLNAPTGVYTVQLSSADGSTGPGLIEIYELR